MASHEPDSRPLGHDVISRPPSSTTSANARCQEDTMTAPDQTETITHENTPPCQSNSTHSHVLQDIPSRDPGYDEEKAPGSKDERRSSGSAATHASYAYTETSSDEYSNYSGEGNSFENTWITRQRAAPGQILGEAVLDGEYGFDPALVYTEHEIEPGTGQAARPQTDHRIDPKTTQTVQPPRPHAVIQRPHLTTDNTVQGGASSGDSVRSKTSDMDPARDYAISYNLFEGHLARLDYPEQIRSIFGDIALHDSKSLVILRISALYRAELHRLQFQLAKDTMEFALLQPGDLELSGGLYDHTEKLNAYGK